MTSEPNVNHPWTDRIVLDPAILTGKPIVKGTRLPVEFVIDLLAQGWSEPDIRKNYPGLTNEDIRACLAYARDMLCAERACPEKPNELEWLNKGEIESVIEGLPAIRALISEACSQLSVLFPGDRITLKSSADPEEGLNTLVLKVKTSKQFDEASELWQHFNEKWWLPNYDRGEDRLCILLDF